MSEIFKRTEMLIGSDALKKLGASAVAVFGVGGVGVRSGGITGLHAEFQVNNIRVSRVFGAGKLYDLPASVDGGESLAYLIGGDGNRDIHRAVDGIGDR